TAAAYVAAGDEGGDGSDLPRDPFGEPMGEPRLNLAGFPPVGRTVAGDKPDRATGFGGPPFPAAVTVSLMWFPLADGLRLGWHTRLQIPDGFEYRLIVDAGDGRILLCKRLTRSVAGHATVVLRAGEPAQAVPFPLPLSTYQPPVPAGL